MSMFNDTVTVYNRFKEDGKERWQRRVVHGVNWTDIQGAVTRKTGVAAANSFTLVLPLSALDGYVTPKAFAASPDKAGMWTVAPQDTVVLGDVDVEITATPGRDLAGWDHVRTVTMADSLMHGRLAHLEVSGK